MGETAIAKARTPALDKLLAVAPKSQAIGDFLEWAAQTHSVVLGYGHEHDGDCMAMTTAEACDRNLGSECRIKHIHGARACGLQSQQFLMHSQTIEKMLAEFFDVDLKAVEVERRRILEDQRRMP